MRLFLLILMWAITLSGFSAAAHAFAPDSCVSSAAAAEKAAAPDVHEMADCMGHQDASGQKKGETGPSAKDSDKKCLDCTHCCLSHVMVIPSFSVDQPQLASFLHSLQGQSPFDDVVFSFLRPPQSLV